MLHIITAKEYCDKIGQRLDRRQADPEQVWLKVKFQEGPVKIAGVNGIQTEDVLEILIERLQMFQAGTFPCAENERALAYLLGAKAELLVRTAARMRQGVEGTDAPHKSP